MIISLLYPQHDAFYTWLLMKILLHIHAKWYCCRGRLLFNRHSCVFTTARPIQRNTVALGTYIIDIIQGCRFRVSVVVLISPADAGASGGSQVQDATAHEARLGIRRCSRSFRHRPRTRRRKFGLYVLTLPRVLVSGTQCFGISIGIITTASIPHLLQPLFVLYIP